MQSRKLVGNHVSPALLILLFAASALISGPINRWQLEPARPFKQTVGSSRANCE